VEEFVLVFGWINVGRREIQHYNPLLHDVLTKSYRVVLKILPNGVGLRADPLELDTHTDQAGLTITPETTEMS
jgi:hypothetical protein